MLTCKAASHLVSESQDRPLGRLERLGLRIHLWMCNNCSRFEDQISQMRHLLRQSTLDVESEIDKALSLEAHERINRALAAHSR